MKRIKKLAKYLYYASLLAFGIGVVYWRYGQETECEKNGGFMVSRFTHRECLIIENVKK